MNRKFWVSFVSLSIICAAVSACSDDEKKTAETQNDTIAAGVNLKVTGFVTQASSGNIESVRAIEGREKPSAMAVASKSKIVHFFENNGTSLTEYATVVRGGSDDNELTNSAVIDSENVLATETILVKTDNKVSDCQGKLLVINISDSSKPVIKEAEVGAMPDAVAVTPDKKYAITADEHDSAAGAWGKCSVETIEPSISIVQIRNDSGAMLEKPLRVKQIVFTENNGPREPEYIAVASDNDTVAVTLQDSHEVAVFSLKKVLAETESVLSESSAKIALLPNNKAGIKPWPDGIVSFNAGGKQFFAAAGEANDTIIILDDTGKTASNIQITEDQVPSSYPCLQADDFPGVKYSPDSITSFALKEHVYVAATLRYAGAVIIYDVTDPRSPVFELIVRSGENDVIGDGVCKYYDGASRVYPEGISAASVGDAAYIWVANEGDSSVTSMRVEVK